jgi:Ca-activated chloride channel homolog
MMSNFHFIRPWWFTALIPLALLIWAIHRRPDLEQAWRGIISPHLLAVLLGGENHRARFSPLVLVGLGWLIAVVAIAGPTWRRQPTPFAEDTAALAIVVKVTPSMKTEDIQPSRLARSVEKIHDLLADRPGAKTALIAYAGTAHRVMPPASDTGIIDTFAEALDPAIMPRDGDECAQALQLADKALAGNGSILWIADSIAPEQARTLADWRKHSGTPIRLLAPLAAGEEWDALRQSARAADADVIQITPDDSDITAIVRAAKYATANSSESSSRWEESGYWLTPVMALLLLMFFRKGWMVPISQR